MLTGHGMVDIARCCVLKKDILLIFLCYAPLLAVEKRCICRFQKPVRSWLVQCVIVKIFHGLKIKTNRWILEADFLNHLNFFSRLPSLFKHSFALTKFAKPSSRKRKEKEKEREKRKNRFSLFLF